jgi:hypothetical protein
MAQSQYINRAFRDLQYSPDYQVWYENYLSALLAIGPAIDDQEEVDDAAEPIFDRVIHLHDVVRHSRGMFWGLSEYMTQPLGELPRRAAVVNVARGCSATVQSGAACDRVPVQ